MIQKFFKTAGAVLLGLLTVFTVRADDAAPDFASLRSYARLANVAYLDQASIKKELDAQHYQLEKYADDPGYSVAWFIASNEATKTQVIVVRGTDNVENAFVDVALQLLPDEKTGVKLHQGFSKSAAYVYQQMQPLLKRDYHMITVGHSLGGAVANILAMYLDVDNYTVDKVVTFGQPKVTNVGGAKKFAHLDVTRVVTPKDVVPLVPPLDPMSMMSMDIYWHMGRELVLLDGNEYALLEGMKSMMRATRFMNTVPNESNLQHHMMTEYLRRIDAKVSGPKQVPYETGFNVLGWN